MAAARRGGGGQAGEGAEALERPARVEGAWFVLCYQLEDTGERRMAWSAGLDPAEAYRQVVGYVTSGMNLWED